MANWTVPDPDASDEPISERESIIREATGRANMVTAANFRTILVTLRSMDARLKTMEERLPIPFTGTLKSVFDAQNEFGTHAVADQVDAFLKQRRERVTAIMSDDPRVMVAADVSSDPMELLRWEFSDANTLPEGAWPPSLSDVELWIENRRRGIQGSCATIENIHQWMIQDLDRLVRLRYLLRSGREAEKTTGLTLSEAVKVARPDQKLRRKSCTGIHLSTASGYNVLQLMDAVADDWEIVQ